MDHNARSPLVFSVIALLCAPVLLAQSSTTPDSTEQTSAEAPKRSRAVSSEVAAALAAGMPKYDPPKPVEPKVEEDLPDLRETDRPRNAIIRLPEYVVREKKPPVFRERDLLGAEGRLDLAKRRYGGLGLAVLPGNKDVARYMLLEDDRLQDMTSFSDLARTAAAGDPEAMKYYKKLGQETYLRPDDGSAGFDTLSSSR